MFTAILILSLGQCGYEPAYRLPAPCLTYQQPAGQWWFVAWQTRSPWNAAVAELRARGPSRSSDRRPPASTWANLEFLALKATESYDTLRAAAPQDKPELRREWIAARDKLAQARLKAAKEARR
jgi:hypothetical protein